jgi:hypothetical protein
MLRANPRYELVALDRLAVAERAVLAPGNGAETYGVLRPRRGTSLGWQAVSPDVALLFLTLQEPAPLPAYAGLRLGDEADRTIARLVADGVLEVEHDGAYVSGAPAGELVLSDHSRGGSGRIGELTRSALRYGQELGGLPAQLLALRLYCYGRRPVSPALVRRLPNAAAIDAHLGIQPGGPARDALGTGWREIPPARGERTYWRSWRRVLGWTGNTAAYKLYVSPSLDAVAPALAAIAELLCGARGANAFKVGADLRGLCRPDKLVAYFDRLEDLHEGAARLRERLDGCPAHGVPFTAAVTPDGLLSWGADPPRESPAVPAGTSWRLWVAERLAECLTLATESEPSGLEPWQFALRRLRLSGIDTDTWVPAHGMWSEALKSI